MPAVRTRRAVLDAAARLLGKNSTASLSDVAAAAGVGRTTVHRCFATREELVRALVEDALDQVTEAIASARPDRGPADAALRRVVDAVVPIGVEVRFLTAEPEMFDDPALMSRWYATLEPISDAVRRGQEDGLLRADLPTAWIVDLLAGAIVTAWDSVDEGRLAAREAPGLVFSSVLFGVTRPRGGDR
jgi:AcrR family transcriptional regulator